MAFQFPQNPSIGTQITNPTTSLVYEWDGDHWDYGVPTGSFANFSNYVFESSGSQTYGNREFIGVTRSTTVQTIPLLSNIIFNQTLYGNGNVFSSYNTATGVFTLTAGKTYELFAQPGLVTGTTGYAVIKWVRSATGQGLFANNMGAGIFENGGTDRKITPNPLVKALFYVDPGLYPSGLTIALRYSEGTAGTIQLGPATGQGQQLSFATVKSIY